MSLSDSGIWIRWIVIQGRTWNPMLVEQFADGSVAFCVLLQHFRNRKLEILLGNMLPPFAERIHSCRV